MIIIIYMMILLSLIPNSNTAFLVEKFKDVDGEYVVYTNGFETENINNVDIVKNYKGQIFTTNISNANTLLFNIDSVASEKIVLKNMPINSIKDILNLDVLEEICVSDNIVLYNCFSNKLDRKVRSNNYVFNIQIAVMCDTIAIGYPYLVDY